MSSLQKIKFLAHPAISTWTHHCRQKENPTIPRLPQAPWPAATRTRRAPPRNRTTIWRCPSRRPWRERRPTTTKTTTSWKARTKEQMRKTGTPSDGRDGAGRRTSTAGSTLRTGCLSPSWRRAGSRRPCSNLACSRLCRTSTSWGTTSRAGSSAWTIGNSPIITSIFKWTPPS